MGIDYYGITCYNIHVRNLTIRGEDIMGFLIFCGGAIFGFITACIVGCAMINGVR